LKSSKTRWSVFGTVILAVIFAALYLTHVRQLNERESLFREIEALQGKLTEVTAEKRALGPQITPLQKKLDEAKAQVDWARYRFPSSIESIEYGNRLFALADDYTLQVTDFSASDAIEEFEAIEGAKPTEEAKDETKDTDAIQYLTSFFEIEVEGEVAEVLDFIHAITSSKLFSSATFSSLEMVNKVTTESQAANTEFNEVEDAVQDYENDHNDTLPTRSGFPVADELDEYISDGTASLRYQYSMDQDGDVNQGRIKPGVEVVEAFQLSISLSLYQYQDE